MEPIDLLRCPRCSITLDAYRSGMWRCPACTGVLVTDAALQESLLEAGSTAVMVGGAARPSDGLRACPRCGDAMAAIWWSQQPVDRCERHGTWFDPDELAPVLRAAAEGAAARREVEDETRQREGMSSVLSFVLDLFD